MKHQASTVLSIMVLLAALLGTASLATAGSLYDFLLATLQRIPARGS